MRTDLKKNKTSREYGLEDNKNVQVYGLEDK